MDFFLEQAKSGRQFILETHSDLLVKRTLRAMLSEEISQENVRVYFTSLQDPDSDNIDQSAQARDGRELRTSRIESIQVNEKGQIANWPPGFMDAEIMESRRLLDAMYGVTEERNDE